MHNDHGDIFEEHATDGLQLAKPLHRMSTKTDDPGGKSIKLLLKVVTNVRRVESENDHG